MTQQVTIHDWDANPDQLMPYPIRVVMHETIALLNQWQREEYGDEEDGESGGVTEYDPDSTDWPVVIHLAADTLYLSCITHEVTHYALFAHGHYALRATPDARARRHILNHDETIPYMVGNATAMLVYAFKDMGYSIDPDS